MRFVATLRSACVSLALLGLLACQPAEKSRAKFIPTNDPNVGILEDRDLQDAFGLNIMVIGQEGIGDYLLGMGSSEYVTTHLEVVEKDGQKTLRVFDPIDHANTLLSFQLNPHDDGRLAIDFASGNNFEMTQTVNRMGGSSTSADGSSWMTVGEPETIRVQQDANSFIADIKHRVKIKDGWTYDANGVEEAFFSEGTVVVRVALHRLTAVQSTALPRISKAEAYQRNFGFQFGLSQTGTTEALPIQRFVFDPNQRSQPQIHYYLKDFPAEYLEIGRQAVLEWNKAFGWNAITVETAPADMDIGDPRYSVIRWIENSDGTLPFAGLEIPGLANKETGATAANNILINGGANIRNYQDLIVYSQRLKEIDPQLVVGRLGNVPVSLNCGETPFIPFVTISSSQYAKSRADSS